METLQAINAYTATYIVIALLAFLLCIVPLIAAIPRIGKTVSRRWVIVVFFIVMAFACIIDFTHLEDNVRATVITGAIVISGIALALFSVEKWMFNGFFAKAGKIEVDVDDKKLTVENAEVGQKEKDDKKPAEKQ
jgi:hypothetical protein